MHTDPSEHEQHQRRIKKSGLTRFLLTFVLLGLTTIIIIVLVLDQPWHIFNTSQSDPTSSPLAILTPTPSPLPSPTPSLTPTAGLSQRIDTYIKHLTRTEQIGQLLMLAVYTNSYNAALNQPLQQWDIANAIVFNQYNGGPLMPTTLSGLTQLVQDLQTHANQKLIIATDEEGGIVD